jgi:3-oxoadipate enol-lactonase
MPDQMSGWFPQSASATQRRVRTGSLNMNIVEAGRGRPVLLIHGLGWDHSLWNPSVEQLAPRYHVIAADTRGHGATDKPDGPYDMAMFARDYAALADALGLTRIGVVGFSQGGMIAQNLALQRPDLVSALMLVSTSCKSHPSMRENMEARIAAADKAGPEAAARIAADSIFSPLWRGANTASLARFVAWRAKMPMAPLNSATRALYDFNLSGDLGRIAVPTLVVAGENDTLTRPEGMREIAALIPGAKFRLVADSGHMIPIEQPIVFASLLSAFLEKYFH